MADSETLWRNAAARSGASKAHYNLALLQEAQGKYDDAIESYKQVTKVVPAAGMLMRRPLFFSRSRAKSVRQLCIIGKSFKSIRMLQRHGIT